MKSWCILSSSVKASTSHGIMTKLSCHRWFFIIHLLTMQSKVVLQIQETDKSVHGQALFAFNTFKSDITQSKGFSKKIKDQRLHTFVCYWPLVAANIWLCKRYKALDPGANPVLKPEWLMIEWFSLFLFFLILFLISQTSDNSDEGINWWHIFNIPMAIR